MIFKLIMPIIKTKSADDDFETDETEPIDAAYKIWEKFSKLLRKGTINFKFSLQDEENNIYDFNVNEKKESIKTDKGVEQIYKFVIEQLGNPRKMDKKTSEQIENELKIKYDTVETKKGGVRRRHRYDDEDSSSSSSDEDDVFSNRKMYKNLRKIGAPFIMSYYPYWYIEYGPVIIPPFKTSIIPYISINLMKN